MTTEATVPDDAVVPEEAVIGYFDNLSNWGRWGSDDEAGTLNLITPERRIRALALARDGVSVSCSRMLAPRPSRWVGFEYTHRMNSSGEAAPEVGSGTASDWFGLSFHGYEHTHLDSHSHVFWNGQMYNGRSAALCTTARGALAGGWNRPSAGYSAAACSSTARRSGAGNGSSRARGCCRASWTRGWNPGR